jgi:hypothetical protein
LGQFLWQGANHNGQYRIIRDLKKLEIIEDLVGDMKTILGIRLTNRGMKIYKQVFGNESKPYRSSFRTTMDHDNLVQKVKNCLIKNPYVTEWEPEWAVRSSLAKQYGFRDFDGTYYKVPDGRIKVFYENKRQWFSLELEIARKSKDRYSLLMRKILMTDNYAHTLMIFTDRKTFKVAYTQYQDVLENDYYVRKHGANGQIYFLGIDDVLKHAHEASFFENLRDRTLSRQIVA